MALRFSRLRKWLECITITMGACSLVMHVNAHALIEGEEAYTAFIDYANTEIEHFKKEVLK